MLLIDVAGTGEQGGAGVPGLQEVLVEFTGFANSDTFTVPATVVGTLELKMSGRGGNGANSVGVGTGGGGGGGYFEATLGSLAPGEYYVDSGTSNLELGENFGSFNMVARAGSGQPGSGEDGG